MVYEFPLFHCQYSGLRTRGGYWGIYNVKKYAEPTSRCNGIAATKPTVLAVSHLKRALVFMVY